MSLTAPQNTVLLSLKDYFSNFRPIHCTVTMFYLEQLKVCFVYIFRRGSGLSNRTFCNEGMVLYLCACLIQTESHWSPVATESGHVRLVQVRNRVFHLDVNSKKWLVAILWDRAALGCGTNLT